MTDQTKIKVIELSMDLNNVINESVKTVKGEYFQGLSTLNVTTNLFKDDAISIYQLISEYATMTTLLCELGFIDKELYETQWQLMEDIRQIAMHDLFQ